MSVKTQDEAEDEAEDLRLRQIIGEIVHWAIKEYVVCYVHIKLHSKFLDRKLSLFKVRTARGTWGAG